MKTMWKKWNISLKSKKTAVSAGGDVVTVAATVILTMGAGKEAAKGIDE